MKENETQFAAYPRDHSPEAYGSIERLKELLEGYHGLCWLMLINLATSFVAGYAVCQLGPIYLRMLSTKVALGLACLLYIGLASSLSVRTAKQIVFGMNRKGQEVIYSAILIVFSIAPGVGVLLLCLAVKILQVEWSLYGVHHKPFRTVKMDILEVIVTRQKSLQKSVERNWLEAPRMPD